jgi:hypothetical protein
MSKDVYELLHLRISEHEWEVLGDFALILSVSDHSFLLI